MAKLRWVAAGVVIVIGVASMAVAVGYWVFTGTPTYALWQVKRAMQHHDLALFRKHFDTRSVARGMADDLAESPREPRRRGLVELMKPRLTEMIETQIEGLVEGTAAARRATAPAATDLGPVAHRIRGLQDVRKDGAVATAHLAVAEPDGSTSTLDVKLCRLDGYWQVFELPNLVTAIRAQDQRAQR